MLVLSRKRNESINIGNDIVIKVIQTSRGTVKLGIDAPAHIRVLRAELTEFATTPVAIVNQDRNGHEATAAEDSNASLEVDCCFSFSADYAAELEDQMLCVATD